MKRKIELFSLYELASLVVKFDEEGDVSVAIKYAGENVPHAEANFDRAELKRIFKEILEGVNHVG